MTETGILLDDRAQRVRVVDEADRYALYVDTAQAGTMTYRILGRRRVLGHTEIDEAFRGRGLSQVLIRTVLDDLREKRERVTIYCPAVNRFIQQSIEYVEVIDTDHPGIWVGPTTGGPAA
ncbi:GNAT family N-acetyltransferase [Streptomyces sp. NPDC093675]|uniref:GNAT family N-acetyltransferase n=1 Tax=Streptomyces sp. NPDC093675 TaxID=3366049 RepID=UPI0037F3706A